MRRASAWRVGGWWWASVLSALAAGPPSAPKAEEPTVMSPFEVTSMSSEFANWSKHRSPHFILYTDGSNKEAKDILTNLEWRRTAEEIFFDRKALRESRTILVMPTVRSDWKKLESKARVEWSVAVSARGEPFASLSVVQYDWQDNGTDVFYGSQGAALLRGLGLGGPLWFPRGIKNFFETARVENGAVVLGEPNRLRLRALEPGEWLPWQRFFAVDVSSREFVKSRQIEFYEGQATAFMHFLLTDPDPAWRERLTKWRTRSGGGTEEEFKEVFGQTYKAWQSRMERHAAKSDYNPKVIPIPAEALAVTVEALDLKAREMRDLFVLVQILNQDVPASEQALDSLLANGLKTPALRGLLAAACFEKSRPEAALAQLCELVVVEPENAPAWAEAARLRLAAAAPQISPDARLGAEGNEIRAWAQRAVVLEPRLAGAWESWAWTEALGEACTKKNAGVIAEIYQRPELKSRRDSVTGALAVALWRSGDGGSARRLCENLRQATGVRAEVRALAEELTKRLSPGP